MKYPDDKPEHGKKYKMHYTDGVTTISTTGKAELLSGGWFINGIMLYDGASFFDAPPAEGMHIDFTLRHGAYGRGWVSDSTVYALMGALNTPLCAVCSVSDIEKWSEVNE